MLHPPYEDNAREQGHDDTRGCSNHFLPRHFDGLVHNRRELVGGVSRLFEGRVQPDLLHDDGTGGPRDQEVQRTQGVPHDEAVLAFQDEKQAEPGRAEKRLEFNAIPASQWSAWGQPSWRELELSEFRAASGLAKFRLSVEWILGQVTLQMYQY